VNRRWGLASDMAGLILLPLLSVLSACVLTQDRLDPALEVPRVYRAAHGPPNAAPPPLDWWQTFRSAELTDLMQQANAANFSIAAGGEAIKPPGRTFDPPAPGARRLVQVLTAASWGAVPRARAAAPQGIQLASSTEPLSAADRPSQVGMRLMVHIKPLAS
jgi:hypothetical protein